MPTYEYKPGERQASTDFGQVPKKALKYNNPTLNEREKTHGEYRSVANLAQDLKQEITNRKGWSDNLSKVQREALALICTKIARIVCGSSKEKDHWQDIAGYAELVVKDLEF